MTASRRFRLHPLAGAIVAVVAVGVSIVAIAVSASASAASGPYMTFIEHSRSITPSVAIANIDGSGVRTLGPGVLAQISPDGSEVAVVDDLPGNRGATLSLYPAGGGSARELYHSAGFISLDGWSADSTMLLAFAPAGLKNLGPLLAITASSGASATIATGNIEGASFSQAGSNDIVYALSTSQLLTAPVNLFTSSPSGGDTREITDDGHSIEPLWGPHDIVFARFKLRGQDAAPINQLWSINADGTDPKQLTHMSVGMLVSGLVPVAFSADGTHLLAAYGGQDTSASWTVDLSRTPAVVRDLNHVFDGNFPDGISRDGKTVLLNKGFEDSPPSVETVPWGGGKPTVVAKHGANASWND
jgi:hypothetical protein